MFIQVLKTSLRIRSWKLLKFGEKFKLWAVLVGVVDLIEKVSNCLEVVGSNLYYYFELFSTRICLCKPDHIVSTGCASENGKIV